MSEEDGKNRASSAGGERLPENYYYGTFQGVANYPPPSASSAPPQSQPVFGFPQPVPPPGSSGAPPHYYPHAYQTPHGYAVAEGRPVREHRLPCCGIGIGWFLHYGDLKTGIPFACAITFRDILQKLTALFSNAKRGQLIPGEAIQAAKCNLFSIKRWGRDEGKSNFSNWFLFFHQYQVVGRALPSETDEHPKIYRMKLWATNEVRAKSKFWYFLRKLKKVKKSNGQMLAINEIFEKNPTKIKNYGIWLRYQSRTGYHNMYKEYRDTTLNGAVEQMYTEMASRHRVRHHCIQIIKTATIPAKLCKRENTKQFHDSKIKFPLVFKKVRPPSRKLKTTYKATRPNLFM
ncbi:60S ribosomal protein L18a [Capsicum annuum]|nr:60S ribosomal protein L18a [Capsicum annuum]